MNDELSSQSNKQIEFQSERGISDIGDKEITTYFVDSKRFGTLVIHAITLLSIVLSNDLFNYEIESFRKDTELKIVKPFKKKSQSIITAFNGLPFLIDSNACSIIKSYAMEAGEEEAENISSEFNMVFLSQLLAKYFYKEKYKDVVDNMLSVEALFRPKSETSFLEVYRDKTSISEFKKNNSSINIYTDVFKLRKVLIPANGVILKINNDDCYIESILLNEFSVEYGLYIIGIIRYKDGSELAINIPVHVYKTYNISAVNAFEACGVILDFYGVTESPIDYDVLAPYYWKYRFTNYETSDEKNARLKGVKVKREYEIEINSFVRKVNGNPSKEALALAKKLFIELEPNHTIVKKHSRTYNKIKK